MVTCPPTSGVVLRSSFDIPENMAHRLGSVSALALVGLGLVNGMEVCSQADLAGAYLCDDRAYRLCVPICVVSVFFPGRTPILTSSLPCLAASHDSSHSSLIVRRMLGFVVAIRIRRWSGCRGGSVCVRVFGLWPVASFAAGSTASLPGTPTCSTRELRQS
jgi:hypothetical protein